MLLSTSNKLIWIEVLSIMTVVTVIDRVQDHTTVTTSG